VDSKRHWIFIYKEQKRATIFRQQVAGKTASPAIDDARDTPMVAFTLQGRKQSSLAPIVREMPEKLRFKLWRHGKVCATRIRLARLNLAGGTIQGLAHPNKAYEIEEKKRNLSNRSEITSEDIQADLRELPGLSLNPMKSALILSNEMCNGSVEMKS
jgi:hypothetical protein